MFRILSGTTKGLRREEATHSSGVEPIQEKHAHRSFGHDDHILDE